MPSSETILAGMTTIANEWRTLAIAWHVLLGSLLLAVAVGWRPATRHVEYLLAVALLSVGILAGAAGNPFNCTMFVSLASLLFFVARRAGDEPVRCTALPLRLPGALLLAFGWSYPHFVKVVHWIEYAYAAPLGIVPCPTLLALIGFTLIFGLFRSPRWGVPLAATGLLYGLIGVFRLEVVLDYGLIAGGTLLAIVVARSFALGRHERTPRRAGAA